MRHYCTLFDRGYFPKGLAMIESLKKHSSEAFTIHVLAMDDATAGLLWELNLPYVDVLPFGAFEFAMRLAPVKASRTWTEYCWTAASQLVDYMMDWHSGGITYLDADLFFFSDPERVFHEIGEVNIGITPHRFPPDKQAMVRNGIYNVGWVTIPKTESGKRCAGTWARQCREWCYARNENGKFGDQGYLDSWPTDYPGEVVSIQNIGVNLAPWNIAQYQMTAGPKANDVPVVCYHLHEFHGPERLTFYPLRDEDREFIYRPYLEAFENAQRKIAETESALQAKHEILSERSARA